MVKVLSQSGDSLADLYDVVGSIAGIDQLITEELPIVHELGATIQSERFSLAMRNMSSGAILQSVDFDTVINDLPAGVTRVLGVFVTTNTAGRTAHVTVSLRDGDDDDELPIFSWSAGQGDLEYVARLAVDGGAVANVLLLRPLQNMPNLPSFLTSAGQPTNQRVAEIAFRGTSTAFGAGTVTARAVVLIAHTHFGSPHLSNRGILIPSW